MTITLKTRAQRDNTLTLIIETEEGNIQFVRGIEPRCIDDTIRGILECGGANLRVQISNSLLRIDQPRGQSTYILDPNDGAPRQALIEGLGELYQQTKSEELAAATREYLKVLVDSRLPEAAIRNTQAGLKVQLERLIEQLNRPAIAQEEPSLEDNDLW